MRDDLIAELDAERAAHQQTQANYRELAQAHLDERVAHKETQAKLTATLAHFDNAFGLQMQSMLAVVERDFELKQEARSLKTQLAETQAKLIQANAKYSSLMEALVGPTLKQELAETRSIVRELHHALSSLFALVNGECPSLLEDDHHYVLVSKALDRYAKAKAKAVLSAEKSQ